MKKLLSEFTYTFKNIEKCNMCHTGPSMQKKIGRRLNNSNGRNPGKKIGISTTIIKCKKCGLVYSNPMPIPYDWKMHYDLDVNDYYSDEFLEIAVEGIHYKGEIDFLNTFKNYYKGEGRPVILDIGSGIGSTLLNYKNAGFDIYGLEPSDAFYEKSKQYLGEDFKKIQHTIFEEAEFGQAQFDFIFSFNVLEHVYSPDALIVQALKWLKPGGLLGLVMPSSTWLTAKLFNFYYRLRGTDLVTNLSPMHNPFHMYEFHQRCFVENAKINDYEIFKIANVTTTTYLPKLLDPLIIPLMRATKTGLNLEVIIRKK